jgi:hypothetical protein
MAFADSHGDVDMLIDDLTALGSDHRNRDFDLFSDPPGEFQPVAVHSGRVRDDV